MNPGILKRSNTNYRDETIQTLFKTLRSHNEIEKRKIMESNKYQHPETIKQCLGDTLGGIVINLIPKDELLWWTENDKVPLHFELKPENMLSGDIKLTPVDNDENTKTLYLNIIKLVGERLKRQAEIKLNEQLNEALQRKVEELMEKKKQTLDEKIRPAERLRYEKNLSKVMEQFNDCKIAKAKKEVKMNIMNKCNKEIENNSNKIARCLKHILKISAEKQENEMRNEFDYQMHLARGKLFEEFMEEKCECELFCEKELKTMKEKNDRELKYLKVSMEAEHIQNLTELELRYEIQKRKKMEALSNTNGTDKPKKKIIIKFSHFDKI